MNEILAQIIGFTLLAGMIFLPGLFVVLSRITIKQPYDKSVAYLCSEVSITPNRWSEVKNKLEGSNSKNIRAPAKTILINLFNPVLVGTRNISAIWYALIFLLIIFMMFIGKAGLQQIFGSVFLAIFYIIVIATVFLYYFRSVASDLYALEERSAITAGFLVDLEWEAINEDLIKLIQEQIKTDHDVFKLNVGFGGIFLIVFSSVVVLSSKLGGSLPIATAVPILGIVVATIFFKWMYESNRSRIVHVALNAIIMVRKESLLRSESAANNAINSDS
jgi:hypothetical protein